MLEYCEPLVVPLASELLRIAKAQQKMTFQDLFGMFPENTNKNVIYQTLEIASTKLAHPTDAIYSALLARKDSGMPGNGFFDLFNIHHKSEFLEIVGSQIVIPKLTEEQKQIMVRIERQRVYEHASHLSCPPFRF